MLEWLQEKLGVGLQEPDIEIKRKFTKKGIKFSIYKVEEESKEKLTFPVAYSQYFDLEKLVKKDFYLALQVLEELWNSGQLEITKNEDYFIAIEDIYQKKEELIGLLKFESDKEVEVKIKEDYPIGSKKFSLDYSLYHPDHGYITKFNDRIGPFFPVSQDKVILLGKSLVELLNLVETPPETRQEQFEYVARVKTKAKKIGAIFSDYLDKEDYHFPEELDVEVEKKDIDHLKLEAKFNDLNQNLNQKADVILEKGYKYGKKKDEMGKNQRIFFDEQTKNDYRQVKNNEQITGADVPELIQNPASFLPESVDLEKFSERVKGLKERVYQAQPYVKGKDSEEMNWFEIETGVNLKQENEAENNTEEQEIEVGDFEKLVQEARENNEKYVLWDGNWVKVPEDSEEFINANQDLEEIKQENKVKSDQMPYVFDIYDNVDRLEYNLELLEKKEELEEAGALKYERPNLLNDDYKLYSYQKEGYLWLNRLQLASLGGLLADDMGLGKTAQVISLMAQFKENENLTPSLVIAPASLLQNWWNEIEKFCPEINDIYIHRGSDRSKDSKLIKKSEVVITTYQTLVRDQVILGEIDWQLMVCDEVQNIKNKSTLAAHAVKAQKSELRLALTGTPIENGLSDLWSIVDYIQPGLLDSHKQFEENFVEPIENCTDPNRLEEYEKRLKSKIKPVYLRRTKEGQLKDKLPPKYEQVNNIEMSQTQQEIYQTIINNEQNSDKRTHLKTLQDLIKLSSHPRLVTKGWEDKSVSKLITEGAKLKELVDILENIKANNQKAIIFTIYREMQYIIQRVIREKFNLDWIPIINGQSNERVKTVEQFNNKSGFGCMILSPRAAGTGLNIVGANHVVHYTRWWNPAVEQQATDRAYRIGQERDVYVYYPIITAANFETVEEKLNRLLKEKKSLAKSIIVPNKRLEKEIKDELYDFSM